MANTEIDYIYTGKLDIVDTIKKIRHEKMTNGRYIGHSKYLWDALELRNDGYDNYEIAETLSVRNNVVITKVQIQLMFDSYKIESNPVKKADRGNRRIEIILDKELFDAIDLECLKTGNTPATILLETYGGKVGDNTYSDKRTLKRIWKDSYNKYYNAD